MVESLTLAPQKNGRAIPEGGLAEDLAEVEIPGADALIPGHLDSLSIMGLVGLVENHGWDLKKLGGMGAGNRFVFEDEYCLQVATSFVTVAYDAVKVRARFANAARMTGSIDLFAVACEQYELLRLPMGRYAP
jgi:hypothetical protein